METKQRAAAVEARLEASVLLSGRGLYDDPGERHLPPALATDPGRSLVQRSLAAHVAPLSPQPQPLRPSKREAPQARRASRWWRGAEDRTGLASRPADPAARDDAVRSGLAGLCTGQAAPVGVV